MKTKLFLGFFCLALAVSAQAQKENDAILFFGFGIGASASSYDSVKGSDIGAALAGDPNAWKDAEDGDGELSYNIGAMCDYFIADRLAVTLGLSYENTPLTYKYPKKSYQSDLDITAKFAFISIPMGVHYYFFDHLLFGGGLYLGIPVSRDIEMIYGQNKESEKLTLDNNVGLFIDFGYNFSVSERHNLLLFLRIKSGFNKIYDDIDVITNIRMASVYIQFAYGYKF